jgi:hypothetical protein
VGLHAHGCHTRDAAGAAALIRDYITRTYEFWRYAAIYDLLEEGEEEEAHDPE